MRRYLLRRLAESVVTFILVTIVVFLGVRALPGDPARALAGEESNPEVLTRYGARSGWTSRSRCSTSSTWGTRSVATWGARPVPAFPSPSPSATRLPVTLQLAVFAMLIAGLIGSGPASSPRCAGARCRSGRPTASRCSACPSQLLVRPDGGADVRHRVPGAAGVGFVSFFDDPYQSFRHLLLPAIVLGTGLAAVIMRQTRSAMLEALSTDYVRTARAKGLGGAQVIFGHALRNSLIVVTTIVGLQLGALISGAVVTEQIFVLPGFGKLTIDAVFTRDFPMIQGVVLVTATAYIGINLVVDLLYSLIDPRIRVGGAVL
jgi:peptide/nickel transport system permease protein